MTRWSSSHNSKDASYCRHRIGCRTQIDCEPSTCLLLCRRFDFRCHFASRHLHSWLLYRGDRRSPSVEKWNWGLLLWCRSWAGSACAVWRRSQDPAESSSNLISAASRWSHLFCCFIATLHSLGSRRRFSRVRWLILAPLEWVCATWVASKRTYLLSWIWAVWPEVFRNLAFLAGAWRTFKSCFL